MVFDIHLTCFDLREIEDLIDDPKQGIATVPDGAGIVVLFGVKVRVHHQPAHPDHRIHRRADFMRHGGEECALGFVCLFGSLSCDFGFVEQLRILHRDHGLIGETFQQVHFGC